MTIYSLYVLLFLFGTSLLLHVQFQLLLPEGGCNGCQIQKVAEVAEDREQRGEGAIRRRDWAEELGHSVKVVMW